MLNDKVYILLIKCSKCNNKKSVFTFDTDIYSIFTRLYNYSMHYQNYILNVKNNYVNGAFFG